LTENIFLIPENPIMGSKNKVPFLKLFYAAIIIFFLGKFGLKFYERVNQEENWNTANTEMAVTAQKIGENLEQESFIYNEVDTTPKATGDAGKVERMFKSFFNDTVIYHNNYANKLNDIGFNDLVNPYHWMKDSDFTQTQETLRLAQQVMVQTRKEHFDLLNALPSRIKALDINERDKRGLLEGARQEKAFQDASINKMWDLEAEIMDEVGRLIEFMESIKGRWSLVEDRMVFESDSDASQFNKHLVKISEKAEEQENHQKKLQERGMDALRQ